MADNPKKNAEGYNDPTPYEAEKHIRAQIRGKQARLAGSYFEAMISGSCDYYLDRGLAKIEKTPEPMKPLGPETTRASSSPATPSRPSRTTRAPSRAAGPSCSRPSTPTTTASSTTA